jgi:hypothetical protein
MPRPLLAALVLLLCPLAASAMQIEEMSLLSPLTGERFTAAGVPMEQPVTNVVSDMGADDDGCRHTSGLCEYDFYTISDPFSLFTAMSVEWDKKTGRFSSDLPDELKEWVRREFNGDLAAARDRAFKQAQAIARQQGQVPPDRSSFVMPQQTLSIDQRYVLARRCYEKRGALPSVLAKISLSGAWAVRCRMNVPIADPRLDQGFAEVNELVAKQVKDGETFMMSKWLAVYRDIFDKEGLTNEGYFVAGAAYFGLTLREGDLAESRRTLKAMDDRFQRIDQKDQGQFLRLLQKERRLSLDRYLDLEGYAGTAFLRAIEGEEFTRARLPQYVLAAAECLRRCGQHGRALAWYACLARMAETQPRLREDIRAQGRAPGVEAPFHVHLGWIADGRIASLKEDLARTKDDPNAAALASALAAGADAIEGPDRRLLTAILFEGLGTAAYNSPVWRPRADGDQQDCQRMLTLIGQSVLDFSFRLGGWPQTLGETWEKEVLRDRNRVNRFHCPVSAQPFLYRPLGIELEKLSPRAVVVATPVAVKTAAGPRYGAFIAGNSVVWSEQPLKPGDEAPR